MSALPFPGENHPLLDLLAASDQLAEWSVELGTQVHRDSELIVAFGAGRRTAAVTLAACFAGRPVRLDMLPMLQLARGDLLLVFTDDGAASPSALRRLVCSGIRIWAVTGPRPNTVADHSHDSVAFPVADADLLSRAHELVVQHLIARPPRRVRQNK